ncbi:MAG: hypothetical protein GY705_28590 [Bacteroidetes bacterium]|nr:hypothetical protein [Bacteroidota bacterium]
MKTYLQFIFLFLVIQSPFSSAQNSKSIMVSGLWEYQNESFAFLYEESNYSIEFQKKDFHLGGFNMSFASNKEKIFHQVGVYNLFLRNSEIVTLISDVSLSEPISGNKNWEFNFGIQHEFGVKIKDLTPMSSFYLNSQILLNYNLMKILPKTSSIFPMQNHSVSAHLGLKPTIRRNFYDHGYIYLGLPVKFLEFAQEFTRIDNPLLRPTERTNSELHISFPSSKLIGLEFGISLNLTTDG